MQAWQFGLAIAAAVLASGLIGLGLQRILPERMTTGPASEMVGAVVGLLSLLSALVLGLLIWTAYGVYAGQNLAIQTLAVKVLHLDLALVDYGPDAAAGRVMLRQDLAKTIDEVWGRRESDGAFVANTFSEALANLRRRQAYLDTLTPANETQTAALGAAKATIDGIAQSRLQMAFALASPVSWPLVYVVMTWTVGLFFGFGLRSKPTTMSVVAAALGALAVGSAAWLIVDLSSPYSGLFRASPAPLQQVLGFMGQGQGAVGSHR